MAPSTAIVTAAGKRLLTTAQLISGMATPGSEALIWNRSPIVSIEVIPAYFRNRNTMMVITTMATNEPGTFFENRGVRNMITILSIPTAVE